MAISSFFSAAALVATALAAQPVPPRPTTLAPLSATVPRSRRATPLLSASFSASSAVKTLANSLSAATTLVQAVSLLLLASSPTVLTSTWMLFLRSTTALMALSWQSPSLRSAWPLRLRQKTSISSAHTPAKKTSRQPLWRQSQRTLAWSCVGAVRRLSTLAAHFSPQTAHLNQSPCAWPNLLPTSAPGQAQLLARNSTRWYAI